MKTAEQLKIEARLEQVKAMHTIMVNSNDEDIYFSWILLMPDEPSEEDFEDFANDEKAYNELFDLFVRLVRKDGVRH